MSDPRDGQTLEDDPPDGDAPDPADEAVDPEARRPDRARDLLGRQNSKLRRDLLDVWTTVKRGFEDQGERADNQMDYWDAYNCVLNANQFYNGDAEVYVPIIRDAINARATRFVNQLFPQGGRYVEAVSTDGTIPHAIVGLLDHYIRSVKLKTQIAKAICRQGDIEGQYNLYVDWAEIEREIVSRETHGARDPDSGIEAPGDDIDDIAVEEIVEGAPACEVLHDSDVLVWPASADTLEEAFAAGGGCAIVRRWSKAKIEAMIEAGHIRSDDGKALLDQMKGIAAGSQGTPRDAEKALNELVGIHKRGTEAVVWEVWKLLPLTGGVDQALAYGDKGRLRLCRMYFGPDQMALGCVRNPNWNDRCNLLSCPVEKVAGVFKGKSQVEPIVSIQYEANDAANEMSDCDHYAALPIVMRNPAAGSAPLVMNIAAVWEVDPAAVKFAQFPDLGQRGVRRIQLAITTIFQSLGVNPSMLPQQTSTAKRNQAQVAQEQAVDLLTTAEAVGVMEEGIFTPLMEWFVDLDYQYRDRPMAVRMYGEMGMRAQMEEVAPLQNRTQYEFRWWGVEQARNAAQQQVQIAWLNVARGVEPLLKAQGYELNVAPVLEASAMAVFGARLAPLVLKDMRAQLSVDPMVENELLAEGHDVPVHPLDPDQEHLIAHQQGMQALGGDPHGTMRVHVQRHLMQMKLKAAAMMAQALQQQMQGQGAPAGGARPSRGGAVPRLGAKPAQPKMMKGPVGAIHPDQMGRAGAIVPPRRM